MLPTTFTHIHTPTDALVGNVGFSVQGRFDHRPSNWWATALPLRPDKNVKIEYSDILNLKKAQVTSCYVKVHGNKDILSRRRSHSTCLCVVILF